MQYLKIQAYILAILHPHISYLTLPKTLTQTPHPDTSPRHPYFTGNTLTNRVILFIFLYIALRVLL